jgi:hypothetical protein
VLVVLILEMVATPQTRAEVKMAQAVVLVWSLSNTQTQSPSPTLAAASPFQLLDLLVGLKSQP